MDLEACPLCKMGTSCTCTFAECRASWLVPLITCYDRTTLANLESRWIAGQMFLVEKEELKWIDSAGTACCCANKHVDEEHRKKKHEKRKWQESRQRKTRRWAVATVTGPPPGYVITPFSLSLSDASEEGACRCASVLAATIRRAPPPHRRQSARCGRLIPSLPFLRSETTVFVLYSA